MNKLRLVLFLTLCTSNIFSQRNNVDVRHYLFDIALNDSTDMIRGKATIQFKMLKAAGSATFDLAGYDRSTGKGMRVTGISENNKALKFTSQPDNIVIDFATKAEAGEDKTVTITYEGVPADGLIISKNKFGDRTIFADNWPTRAHYWIPCNDDPSDKAAVTFSVTAPEHYQVISNGLLTEETNLPLHRKLTRYDETVELPTKVMVIGLADFAVQRSGDVNCIPLYSWVYPQDKVKGFFDYALAKDILAWFIDSVGPYSYRKLANVQSTTIYGGMENAGAIFYGENTLSGNGSNEALITHEIAHQWFGNSVTEKSYSHVWLSEGFATYFTDLYFEAKYGESILKDRLQKERIKAITFSKKTTSPVVDTISEYSKLLNAFSYEKGAWVLHMLRRKVGDENFWKAIRVYYKAYGGKNANTDDLRNVFENVCGCDLKTFFHQWLYVKDHPVLNVTWYYNASKKNIVVNIMQQQPVAFDFPLQIKIAEGAIKQIDIRNRQTSITIPCNEKPVAIDLDPDVNLFFEGRVKFVDKTL